ncbi:MAG: tetratricopeptide repeat protein [Balneolales bacterium]
MPLNSKRILVIIPLLVIAVLIGVIYVDSLERSEANDVESVEPEQHHSPGRSDAEEPDTEDMERILHIEKQLEEIDNEHLAIAFYGELIQIYIENDRLDGAAEAAGRMAGLTGEFEDWKNAGDWYHQWVLRESDPELIHYHSHNAVEMYEAALAVDSTNARVRTDVAVEYMRLGESGPAIRHLETVLSGNPDNFEANYNLGVILHQTGSKDKSISYLKRSLELAGGTENEEKVQSFLQQIEINI